MDWKEQNPRARYIDGITPEEARHLAWLSQGKPISLTVKHIERTCNGNNIPHVKIYYDYFCAPVGDDVDGMTGIFENGNVYTGEHYHSAYCQLEIAKYLMERKFFSF